MWVGVGAPWPVSMGLGLVAAVVTRRHRDVSFVVVALLVGMVVGMAAGRRADATRHAIVPTGGVEMTAVALTDPYPGLRPVSLIRPTAVRTDVGWARWDGPPLLLIRPPSDVLAGEPLGVTGSIDPEPGSFRGRAIGGVVSGRSERLGSASNPFLRVGNVLRGVVLGHLDTARERAPGALLAGFLIGDTSHLPERDDRALRQAGLSHFVAVSGSNVALFLAAWWIVGGPLGLGPRRRAAFGLVGILVFAVVTRWEPSVVRASVMAGLVLVGRWSGRSVTPWTALGGAVATSLVVAPELAGSVGFALSVAATGGILCGVPLWAGRRPVPLWAVLGATVSAQAAVAPLLLLWFGSVPLMAPLANLLAAPIVAASTAVGGIGAVFGLEPLIRLGSWLAGLVLAVARSTASLPQLGAWSTLGLAAVGVVALRAVWIRPLIPVGVAIAVMISIAPVGPPGVATVSFLDVGQGDATLFRGPSGATILVDGGPDPSVLEGHLARFGVDRVDLLVITHLHADHTTGLVGITQVASVGMLLYPPQEGEGGPFDAVVAEVRGAGARVEVAHPGDELLVGSLRVEVVAPVRRYASPNDGSVVILVSEPTGATVVMTGDLEVPSQMELGPLRGDIMKVPHQGAATSDLDWLEASVPLVAVISVGPNDYGHPSDAVITTLEGAGAIVLRTDRDGTVTLPIAGALDAAVALTSGG